MSTSRGITPGTPTNSGSFKAETRGESEVALDAAATAPFMVSVQPQAWIRDMAIDSDPPVYFDIAPMLADMEPTERARLIKGLAEGDYDAYNLDDIYLDAAERGLVEKGYGPFDVSSAMAEDEMYSWSAANPYEAAPDAAPDAPDDIATTAYGSARRLVDAPVADVLRAEIANERHGGVSPATLSSTIDSINQGLLHDNPHETHVMRSLLVVRDLLPGDTEVNDLL